jgi:glycosyltransferase involved in cell wall biosynthesis
MPITPPLFHRTLAAFARLGLDIRPTAQRVRNAILRPVRADVAIRFDQAEKSQRKLEALLAAQAATLDRQAARQEAAAEGFAERDRVRAEQIASLNVALVEQRAAFERAAEMRAISFDRAIAEQASAFATTLSEQGASFVQALSEQAANSAQRATGFDRTLAEVQRLAGGERDELNRRCLLLEQLLTGTAASRPPGALAAVALLEHPGVSVILPTYNRAAFVAEAIASVQAQSFANWELIVVDDGSTDDTAAAVASFSADLRIRYLRQDRTGVAAARNCGLAETAAPIVAYLDSDNLWYPDFLSRAVDCLATEPGIDMIYGALVTEWHNLDTRCVLWSEYDRGKLLAGNFIDTNVLVHRRSLVTRYGGWDTTIDRLLDWDLVLRYTAEKPARALNVLAAYYRRCDEQRVTDIVFSGPSDVAIRNKWFPPPALTRPPRVLYAVWHYPQLSEAYVETELRCMQAWGVHVEIWRSSEGPSPYPTNVPIHGGTLTDAIAASRPDAIHVHWLSFGYTHRAELEASGLPVTFRLHGFDVTRDGLALLLGFDWVKAVYAFPNQIANTGLADVKLKAVPVAFDTGLFKPVVAKDRRLVVRMSAALASKDLELFFEAARLLPEYRFVLATVTCHMEQEYADYLKELHASTGSPVELRFDLPRDQVAELLGQAGIYLHTLHPPGHPLGTPVGQPISLAEAMATGCYCLVRDVPDLVELVGAAGATYSDVGQLVDRIRETASWDDAGWNAVQMQAVEIAYGQHADKVALRLLYEDWMAFQPKL